MSETFRFIKGNAVEDARNVWSGGESDPEVYEMITVRGEDYLSTHAAEDAARMAYRIGSPVSVSDDSFSWCVVFDANGDEIDSYSCPYC